MSCNFNRKKEGLRVTQGPWGQGGVTLRNSEWGLQNQSQRLKGRRLQGREEVREGCEGQQFIFLRDLRRLRGLHTQSENQRMEAGRRSASKLPTQSPKQCRLPLETASILSFCVHNLRVDNPSLPQRMLGKVPPFHSLGPWNSPSGQRRGWGLRGLVDPQGGRRRLRRRHVSVTSDLGHLPALC